MFWLEERSSKIAAPLRAVHIDRPKACLRLVRETLERKFGTAEVIEDNLIYEVGEISKVQL